MQLRNKYSRKEINLCIALQ